MFASNRETSHVRPGYPSATSRKPFHNVQAQLRAPESHDPGEDHDHSSGRRSGLPAEVPWLGADSKHMRSGWEEWVLPWVFRDPLLRTRSRKHLPALQHAPAML